MFLPADRCDTSKFRSLSEQVRAASAIPDETARRLLSGEALRVRTTAPLPKGFASTPACQPGPSGAVDMQDYEFTDTAIAEVAMTLAAGQLRYRREQMAACTVSNAPE